MSIYTITVGLILTNIAFYKIDLIVEYCPILITIYILTICMGIITLGFLFIITAFLKSKKDLKINSDYETVPRVWNYYTVVTYLELMLSILIIAYVIYPDYPTIGLYKLTSKMALGSITMGSIFIALRFSQIPKEAMSWISREKKRFSTNYKKIKNAIIVSSVIFILFSLYIEYMYRRDWVVWIESQGIIVAYLLLLTKFARILFEAVVPSNKEEVLKSLPQIKVKVINRCLNRYWGSGR